MIQDKLAKSILSLGILIFFSISLFGVFHMGMKMDKDGMDSGCPFALGSSICTMTPLEHLGAIQSLFTALPKGENTLASLLFLTLGLIALPSLLSRLFLPPKLLYKRVSVFEYRYTQPKGFLQEAFSNGILNSRAF